MAKTSTGVTLTTDFYMNNFYRANRAVVKPSNRKDYSTHELSYEDARALKRAAKRLGDYDYTNEKDLENVFNSVSAFVKTYNNALESSSGSNDADVSKMSKQLKKLSEKYGDDLKSIGITVEKDGSLNLNEGVMKAKEMKDFKNVFTKNDGDLLKTTSRISKKLLANTYDAIYQDLTGSGATINITL